MGSDRLGLGGSREGTSRVTRMGVSEVREIERSGDGMGGVGWGQAGLGYSGDVIDSPDPPVNGFGLGDLGYFELLGLVLGSLFSGDCVVWSCRDCPYKACKCKWVRAVLKPSSPK